MSDVGYYGLRGTSISKNDATITFNCSKTVHCTNINVDDVDIKSAGSNQTTRSFCSNAHGKARGLMPALGCLLK